MTFDDWQRLTPAEGAREMLRRVDALSPALRTAAIAVLPDEAALVTRFACPPRPSPPSLLSGVPYFLKDLFDVAGEPTRAGSAFLAEVRPVPAADSAIVRSLRSAGAVLGGKAHLHEFAYGLTGENLHFGDVEHPRFPGRTSGGSSSGSAALVAAGVVPLAIGTDTGGSVRVPAAFCGLFGFRLTPHDRFIGDAFPLAPSFDTAGWFTANAGDMRRTISALVGLRGSQRTPRGVYIEPTGLDPDVAAACRTAAGDFAPPGDEALARDWDKAMAGAVDAFAVMQSTEAFAVHRDWLDRFRERYSPQVWLRIDRGRQWTDAQRSAAQIQLIVTRQWWTRFFLAADFLVLPATPGAALTRPEFTLESRNRILALTTPASLAGLPVLTVPVPLPSGLSTGLQIVVNHPQSPVVNWVLEKLGG
jgi:amidase/aspartyl-tRNA(Asn)/glutamyl-tRNA(Gln) amidotransferase subunit A